MKTFVFSAHPYEIPFLNKAAEGKHELIFTEKKLSTDTALLAAGCEAVAIFTADDASAPILNKLNSYGVRFVALRSAGYDHIDLGRAEQCGMQVANVPAYSPYSIAEHAAAMLLTLNRRIVEAQTLIRLRDFRLDSLVGFDIHGKTVGIIGTGTIGTKFAHIMNGFGARLIGVDPVKNEEAVRRGLEYVTLVELLERSDVISIHCPLNEHTHHMISRHQFEKMKKGAILINTSRGAIVNSEDLLMAVENEHLGGACLDVYEREKALFFEDHRNTKYHDITFSRFLTNRNILVTGHQAFLTREALTGIAQTTIENLDFWEDGEESPHQLTRTVGATIPN